MPPRAFENFHDAFIVLRVDDDPENFDDDTDNDDENDVDDTLTDNASSAGEYESNDEDDYDTADHDNDDDDGNDDDGADELPTIEDRREKLREVHLRLREAEMQHRRVASRHQQLEGALQTAFGLFVKISEDHLAFDHHNDPAIQTRVEFELNIAFIEFTQARFNFTLANKELKESAATLRERRSEVLQAQTELLHHLLMSVDETRQVLNGH